MTIERLDERRAKCTEREVRLPVRLRRIEHSEGASVEVQTVHCPVVCGAQALDHCTSCSRFLELFCDEQGAAVGCVVPAPGADRRSDRSLCEVLGSVSAAEVAQSRLTCLDPELEAGQAAWLLARDNVGSAPVVDDNGVLLGSVSAEALARTGFDVEVEDAMSLGVPTVLETASVGEAVSLMSRDGVDRMPIVTARAEVVGVIAAMDVIRWLQRALTAPRKLLPEGRLLRRFRPG